MKFETMRERTLYLDYLKPRVLVNRMVKSFLEKDLAVKTISLPVTSPYFK
jgi:hypothetical protein